MNKKYREAKAAIEAIALQKGISAKEVKREIEFSIAVAWATTNPEAKAFQNKLFPDGQPTREEMIVTLAELNKTDPEFGQTLFII